MRPWLNPNNGDKTRDCILKNIPKTAIEAIEIPSKILFVTIKVMLPTNCIIIVGMPTSYILLTILIFNFKLCSFIFNSDPVLVNTGVQAFRRITLLFFIVGPGVILMTLFQATGAGMKAFLIFAVRQIIAFIPLFYCFSIAFNLPDIWFAFPISDAIAIGVGGVLSFSYLKKLDII